MVNIICIEFAWDGWVNALVVLAAKVVAADSKRQELGDRRTSIFKFDVLQSTPRSPRS